MGYSSWIYVHLQPPLPPIWTQEIIRFGALAAISLIATVSWKLFESPMVETGEKLARLVESAPRRLPLTTEAKEMTSRPRGWHE